MNVGERLKKRRTELGLTADEVANVIKVSRSTYYRYESGDIEKVPTTVVAPLCKILKSSPEYLMGWDDNAILEKAIHGFLGEEKKEIARLIIKQIYADETVTKIEWKY